MDGSEYMTSPILMLICNCILPGNCWFLIRPNQQRPLDTTGLSIPLGWSCYVSLALWHAASTLFAPGWCVWCQDTHYQFQGTEILRIFCRCLDSRVLSRVAVTWSYFNFWGFKVVWTIQLKYLNLKIFWTLFSPQENAPGEVTDELIQFTESLYRSKHCLVLSIWLLFTNN